MKNILVTGAGALLGQGILRCLSFSKKDYKIVSADPDVRSTGHALATKSYKIPYASERNYLEKIEEIISVEKIDIILIGTDVELPFFSEKKAYLEEKYSLKVVVSESEVIKIANDKWLTAEFLKSSNFPYPLSARTTDRVKINYLKENKSFPFIAKPVDGARSKGLKIVKNNAQLEELCAYDNNLVVQEMLEETTGEYTTGCLVVGGKCKAVVSMVRELRDGNTWRAYRRGDSPHDKMIASIAEALSAEGPVNFQYRIRNGEPVIFEINCRFSGTTPLRLMFGFNEVEALLDYYFDGEEIVQPELKEGTLLRTFSDIFIENEVLETFDKEGVTKNFHSKYYPFKYKS